MYKIGKATYQAIFPSTREQYREERQVSLNPSLNDTLSPWGWSSDTGHHRAIPVPPTVKREAVPAPWGWPGSDNNTEKISNRASGNVTNITESSRGMINNRRKEDEDRPVVGWPYREEKFEFAGRNYKVARKKRSRKTNIGGISKPWGW